MVASPCPFCGEKLRPWRDEFGGRVPNDPTHVHPFNDCLLSGYELRKPVQLWNRRVALAKASLARVEAAARKLMDIGNFHGWWGPARTTTFTMEGMKENDPIGYEAHLSLAAEILAAADDAKEQTK